MSLGLADNEYWELTPRQFSALLNALWCERDWQAKLAAVMPFHTALMLGSTTADFDRYTLTRAAAAAVQAQADIEAATRAAMAEAGFY